MLGLLAHARPERCLVGDIAVMRIEIIPLQLLKRPPPLPRADEEVANPAWHHGEDEISDAGGEQPVSGSAERHPRDIRGAVVLRDREGAVGDRGVHAALPSTISAPTSSADTSSSTARG